MNKINKYIVNSGIVLFAAGLAYFAYLGFYNRHWSDDWCYNRDFKQLGFLRTLGTYAATGEEALRGWSVDRYSMTIFSWLFNLPGVFGTQILAAVTIVLWLATVYWVLSNLAKLNKADVPKNILLLFSTIILYYTLYISPDRFQILYWRSGVLPYSFSIIFGLILLGLITNQAPSQKVLKSSLILTALVGVIGGGFSEIGSVFLFGSMTLLFLAAWWSKRAKKDWAVNSFSTIQTAWLALLVALILLLIAPSNAARSGIIQKGFNDIFLVPSLSVQSALFFITRSIIDMPIPHLILVTSFASISMLAHTNNLKIETKQAIRLIIITAVISLLVIIAIQAPTHYLYSAQPDPRGQSLSRFIMTVGLAFISWALGGIAAPHTPSKLILVPIVFILLGYAYTARAIRITSNEYPGFVQRAQIWDARDIAMRDAAAQGVTRMEVVVIDTHEIGTKDIMRSVNMTKWAASCAATYYGMDEIKALESNP